MDNIKKYSKNAYEKELQKEYEANLQDKTFKEIITKLKIDSKTAILNNSIIMDCANELKNCAHCKGLHECQNKVLGYYLYPKKYGDILDFGYEACKYEQERIRLLSEKRNSNKELANARFKYIDISDKKRLKLIKWLKEFYDNYDISKDMKGLYLHGVFGSGKTYLLYALLNELKINKKVESIAIYYPDALKNLKEDWDTYSEKLNRLSEVPILLIDDIGAETVSEWGRDEVLGTILQYRMNNYLPTFFTSNLTLEELEEHLASTKTTTDKVKARRIIERIKFLTTDLELISENKRK